VAVRHTSGVQSDGTLLANPKMPHTAVAKFCFWYVVVQLKKTKKSSGETVYCRQVFEKSPLCVKNFGFWLHYDSHSGTHNGYLGYQDLTTAGVVTQCYRDMGAPHTASRP
jgi:large subunit ribosomal protein L18Ae